MKKVRDQLTSAGPLRHPLASQANTGEENTWLIHGQEFAFTHPNKCREFAGELLYAAKKSSPAGSATASEASRRLLRLELATPGRWRYYAVQCHLKCEGVDRKQHGRDSL
jgi:hypothetical protein